MKKIIFLSILISTLCSISFSQDSYSQFVSKFDYDVKTPLDVQETSVETRDSAKVYNISYASLKGGRVPAYLVVPEKKGNYAAVLFGHWAMAGSPFRNKTEFLD